MENDDDTDDNQREDCIIEDTVEDIHGDMSVIADDNPQEDQHGSTSHHIETSCPSEEKTHVETALTVDDPTGCEATPKLNKFNFILSHKKWKKMSFARNHRGDRRFTKGWTEMFAKKICKENSTCPLIFKTHYIRKENSRKKHMPFFTAKAFCKFPGCVRYKIRIKKEPKVGKTIKVRVTLIKPFDTIKHEAGVKKGRPIMGSERAEIAKTIKEKGPSNVFYQNLGDADEEAIQAGNTSGFGTKAVMQKISSECNMVDRLHKDVIVEAALLKKVYEKEYRSESAVKGCIQSISLFPFSVSIYSDLQISILAKEMSRGRAVLYLDATGSVISNIPSQPKKVFYYPLLLKGCVPGDPPIPVAEFISNSHKSVDVSHFLLRFNTDLHQCHPTAKVPTRIEIDYSWSFIHGIVWAFNHEDIYSYLQRCWNIVHEAVEWGDKTKIHLCSAHILHQISGHLRQSIKDKTARHYMLYVIARMIDASNLEELGRIFRSLCILLTSECDTSEFHDAKKDLDRVVTLSGDPEPSWNGEADDEALDEPTSTKPSYSAFGMYFRNIAADVRSSTETPSDQGERRNIHYSPETVTYLLSNYMGIVPLWTGILLGDIRHDTNSPAENWMGIVKRNIFQGVTRLRPSDFIIEIRSTLKGRLREYLCHTNEKSLCDQIEEDPVLQKKKQKTKSKKNGTSFDVSEEKWDGKKTKKMKKKYFLKASPKILRKSTSASRHRSEPAGSERGLHWGGKVQIDDRIIHMSNTCPVDNLLMITFFLLKCQRVHKWFEERARSIEVCQVLLEINSLFTAGNWSEGRALWLSRYCSPPNTKNWNMYGSECEHDRDPDNDIISLEESFQQWEAEFISDCSAGPTERPCKGIRTCTRRVFSYDRPPVLIASINFLHRSRGLTPAKLPHSINVLDARYDIFAYTVGVGEHFKAYFLKDGLWHMYDDLNNPEIIRVDSPGEGHMEHVVLVVH